MKNLKEYILESLLDDEEDLIDNDDAIIKDFLKKNYNITGSYTIKNKVVDAKGDVIVKNNKITSLTNELFEFGKVDGAFKCFHCRSLKTLKGAPKEVSGGFYCGDCPLTSLEGAPKKIDGGLYCYECPLLISLKGAPKEVGGGLYCSYCKSLTSLEGAPKAKKIISDL